MEIGRLFLDSVNVSVPVIFLTVFGFLASFKLFPPKLYTLISALTFSISMPISTIYIIGRQNVSLEDVMFVLAYLLTFATLTLLLLPQALLYYHYIAGLSHLIVTVVVNNAIFSGVPVCEGLYDAEMCSKYGYMIVLGTNILILPVVYTLFEISAVKGAGQSKCAIFCKAVKQAFKYPMVISVLIGLCYCVLQMFAVPFMGRLPVYLAQLFNLFGDFAANSAMVMLGFFLHNQIDKIRAGGSYKPMGRKEVMSFIIIVIHRHLTAPLLLVLYCYWLGVGHEVAEITAILYSGPSAILSFAISDQYGTGAFAAGIECCFGVFVGTLVIPLVQLTCRSLYGVG